jgi:hypothetical protein
MLFVTSTTMTAGYQMITGRFAGMWQDGWQTGHTGKMLQGGLNSALIVFLIGAVLLIFSQSLPKWVAAWTGREQNGQ